MQCLAHDFSLISLCANHLHFGFFLIFFLVFFLSLGLYFGLRSPSCCHHMGSPQIHRFVKCAHCNQSFYVYSTEIPYILRMHRILLLCLHCTFSTNFKELTTTFLMTAYWNQIDYEFCCYSDEVGSRESCETVADSQLL